MFSGHYLISHQLGGMYWNGLDPREAAAWVTYDKPAVRFHTRESAELVIAGVLTGISCRIAEDE